MKIKTILFAAMVMPAILSAPKTLAQANVGQWDFESKDLSQTAGANLGPLTYYDGPNGTTSNETHFGSTTTFGIPGINGDSANVMLFPGNSILPPVGFLMPTPPANGGGALVNDYTLIVDVFYTNNSIFRPIIEMDNGSLDNIQAYFAINSANQIVISNTSGAGLASAAFGNILPNTWYRIGFVLNTDVGEVDIYTNGLQAGFLNIGTGQIDSPYTLYSGQLPLFSSTVTNAPGFVNSVQLRDEVLNPGQMEALGGPTAAGIPITLPPADSYIVSRVPQFGDTGIGPEPSISVVLDEGSTTIDQSSISLLLDGVLVPATVAPGDTNEFTINYSETNTILDPLTTHTLTLVYHDSLVGTNTDTWQFTIANYQNLTLPAPIYYENFDELSVTNGTSITPAAQVTIVTFSTLGDETNFFETNGPLATPLPPGWTVTNLSVIQADDYDLTDAKSDSYLNWVVVSTNYFGSGSDFDDQGFVNSSPGLGTAYGFSRLVIPPIVLNGVLLESLAESNWVYAESDNRQNEGGQVNVLFTSDYNLTGYSNVYVAFHSLYEQNQDSMGSVEYSIDQGTTWLPALYMLDDGSTDGEGPAGSDVVTNAVTGQIDVVATFGTARSDQAFNFPYGSFIGAAISTNLIPFISPRRQDDPINSKRIEVIRLAQADNQAHVRFRFCQAGTSSWFFGFDDFGIYSISTPVISSQPVSQIVNANTTVSFSVAATGLSPFGYQWKFNGNPIQNATNSTYTISSALPVNDGIYTVVVNNVDGPVTSAPAQLTVNTKPQFTTVPCGEIADPGATVTFTTVATGGQPMTFLWYLNGGLISTSTNSPLVLPNVQAGSAGTYQVVASDSYGAVTSSIALLKIWKGPIISNLVVHLAFDGNFNDSSGRNNNAAYAVNGANANPNPTFVPGKIGQAFQYTTLIDASVQEYATLGYPLDLQFGGTNDFSVSMWVNYVNQSDDLPFISNKDWNSSSDQGWGIFTQTGGNFRVNVTGPNLGADKYSETDTPSDLKDGNWHNIMVSFQRAPFGSSAFVYEYLDSVLVSKHPMDVVGTIDTFALPFTEEQNVPDNQSTWAVNIGQDGTGVYHDQGSAYDINAMIDDVGIWRRALTANEAMGIYLAGQAGNDFTMAPTTELTVIKVGQTLQFTWLGSPTVELQTTAALSPTSWQNVAGTLGASSASVPISGTAAFFRLVQVP